MFNHNFFELGQDIIPLINQVDVNTDATGDFVKLTHYDRALILVAKYGSEDVDTLGVQIVQATAAAGTGQKGVSAKFQYWYKQGTLTSQGIWTAGQLATADDILGVGSAAPTGGTQIISDVNTNAFVLAIDVPHEYLDFANGFDWLTVQVEGDEVDNSILVSAWAILYSGRFKQNVPLTAIS